MAQLADPTVDVYVLEGKKKAMSLAAEGRCTIAVWGTWAWGKTPEGGSRCELLPDWDLIALDGRRVFIVFDSDREDKPEVDLAARHLAARLAERGAEVYHVMLPSEADGVKNGADDLKVRHGFEAFERCVEAAIDRGPHGTEALRAAYRRERAQNRDLKARWAAESELLAMPTTQLDPSEKVLLLTAASEIAKRTADRSSADYRPFDLATMAHRAGLSPGTYGRKLERFCTGELRLWDKDRRRLTDDPDDPRRPIFLRAAREGCAGVADMLWAAVRAAAAIDKEKLWGGKREPKIAEVAEETIPPCPDHPGADAIRSLRFVCAAPVGGGVCGTSLGEPINELVPRNMQLDVFGSEDDSLYDDTQGDPFSVVKGAQVAISDRAPPHAWCQVHRRPFSQAELALDECLDCMAEAP